MLPMLVKLASLSLSWSHLTFWLIQLLEVPLVCIALLRHTNHVMRKVLFQKGAKPNARCHIPLAPQPKFSYLEGATRAWDDSLRYTSFLETLLHVVTRRNPHTRPSTLKKRDFLMEFCKLLIKAGSNINAIDVDERYPIQ